MESQSRSPRQDAEVPPFPVLASGEAILKAAGLTNVQGDVNPLADLYKSSQPATYGQNERPSVSTSVGVVHPKLNTVVVKFTLLCVKPTSTPRCTSRSVW